MINWYEDENLAIEFNDTPKVCVRYALPSMTDIEKKQINKYPFTLKKELTVRIVDKKDKKGYRFTIPKSYCYDGASIPKPVHSLIGSNTESDFLIAALIHDALCENHQYINNNRALSTNVFNALLKVAGVNPIKRCLMKNSVACFQTLFCGW